VLKLLVQSVLLENDKTTSVHAEFLSDSESKIKG